MRNIREEARVLALKCGVADFELCQEDVRLLLICRAVGHGSIEKITVVDGRPSVVLRVEDRIDLRREVEFGAGAT